MAVNEYVSAPILHAWGNPLLQDARRERPMPLGRIALALGIAAGAALGLAILSWIAQWRIVGAAVMAISLAPGLIAALIAAPMGAGRIAWQMRSSSGLQRRIDLLAPRDAVIGLSLVTLWQLRWLIAAMLALTPALVLSLLHLNIVEFSAWRDSALALGDASAIARTGWLLPDGSIPYFRLILRAASAGGLAWAALPLTAALGVTSALALRDVTLGQLTAVLGGALAGSLLLLVWEILTRTPLLAGGLEFIRLILLIGLLALPGVGTRAANRLNARLLMVGQ